MITGVMEYVGRLLRRQAVASTVLGGNAHAQVVRLDFATGAPVVVKHGAQLDAEAWMLRFLADHSALPVPQVIHAEDGLLVMEYVPAGEALTSGVQIHAADLLAALHDVHGDAFGAERQTAIGGLVQPNPPTRRWVSFFRDQRLLHMAQSALGDGRLPVALMGRIEALAGRLEQWLDEPAHPSLIHGDCWGGNILAGGGQVRAFIDPALYFADPEIELAFITLFGTFGEPFFARYGEHHPIRDGFWDTRRDLYNLYPLLVHVRLFGGTYLAQVERIVHRFVGGEHSVIAAL